MSFTLVTFTVPGPIRLADESPEPEDVKAGWTAFAMFLLLGLAVVFLGLQPGQAAAQGAGRRDAGAFGDPVDEPTDDDTDSR